MTLSICQSLSALPSDHPIHIYFHFPYSFFLSSFHTSPRCRSSLFLPTSLLVSLGYTLIPPRAQFPSQKNRVDNPNAPFRRRAELFGEVNVISFLSNVGGRWWFWVGACWVCVYVGSNPHRTNTLSVRSYFSKGSLWRGYKRWIFFLRLQIILEVYCTFIIRQRRINELEAKMMKEWISYISYAKSWCIFLRCI